MNNKQFTVTTNNATFSVIGAKHMLQDGDLLILDWNGELVAGFSSGAWASVEVTTVPVETE